MKVVKNEIKPIVSIETLLLEKRIKAIIYSFFMYESYLHFYQRRL